ncbi:hypothetical protein QN355_16155 [Cryobacterium sp. 10S3]|uniref:hypothetical protein n=1 Tax=Cryobacterium sp. 10S3 TaxID=3048582 RepID=UPI002AC94ED2|nr:hypothetical protein [Cryobacterium sp. 10S3]MEB0288083.1 hypothetical protein [Cryobacterium sp. 10S3]WPX12643.1 hypothetical protein RHM57_13285 [Cryobacterium sp. 10S3]
MKFKNILASAVIGAVIVGGISAAPASAAPNSDTVTDALNSLGLLSNTLGSGAARATVADPGTTVLTAERLQVRSKTGTVEIAPVSTLSGALSADSKVTILAGPDSSYALTSQSGGAQANAGYIVLHNKNAPTDYRFQITANDKPAVLSEIDGRILVSDQNGIAVNVIGSAWAKDAQGSPVETSYTIDGNTLIQSVAPSSSTAFPVVADPRVQCDFVWCTLEFTKTETQTASETAVGAGAVLCGGAALLNPIIGFACGVYSAAFWVAAVQAKNTGQCVGFRMLAIGGSAHPVIINCYA